MPYIDDLIRTSEDKASNAGKGRYAIMKQRGQEENIFSLINNWLFTYQYRIHPASDLMVVSVCLVSFVSTTGSMIES